MDYIEGINCPTKEYAQQILEELTKQNYVWEGSKKPASTKNYWDMYESKTCYFVNKTRKTISYGSLEGTSAKNYDVCTPYTTKAHVKVTIVVDFDEEQLKKICNTLENEPIIETINNRSIAELLEKGTYNFKESKTEYTRTPYSNEHTQQIITEFLARMSKINTYFGEADYEQQEHNQG